MNRYDDLPARWCDDCGSTHDLDRRLRVLRRMLPATREDIHLAHAHLWPTDGAGRKALERDLQALGAIKAPIGAMWRLP